MMNARSRFGRASGAVIAMAVGLCAGVAMGAAPPPVAQVAPAAFATPEDAVKALKDATAAKDKAALDKIFGTEAKELVNPDAVQRENECADFNKHLAEMTNIVRSGDDRATVYVGKENWPFPIPLVKKDKGWVFDAAAGREEILARRIGENELNTIDVCRAYVTAQREYHMTDWNHDDILEYAQHLASTQGKRDGLYWDAGNDEAQSPFGQLVASAHAEGYPIKEHDPNASPGERPAPKPFHGYYFRILTKQGPHAPGGAYDYVANGHMIGGFALIAYPAEWGNSGVMTFIVNQRGKVFQKNLGAKTVDAARAIMAYDPDESWEPVSP